MFFKRKNSGCSWRDTIVSPHSRMHQEKVHLRKTNIIIVWDKTIPNRNIIIHISSEISMSSTLYQEIKFQKDDITIVLEFPKQSGQTDHLLQEIRSILAISLREQLQKNLTTSTDKLSLLNRKDDSI